jgi:hypothetical protein
MEAVGTVTPTLGDRLLYDTISRPRITVLIFTAFKPKDSLVNVFQKEHFLVNDTLSLTI